MGFTNLQSPVAMENHHPFWLVFNPYLAIEERFKHEYDCKNILLFDLALRIKFCDNPTDRSFHISLVQRAHLKQTFENVLKFAENGIVFDIVGHEINNLF